MPQLISPPSANGSAIDTLPVDAPALAGLPRGRQGTRPLVAPGDRAPGELQGFLASVLHTLPDHVAILDETGKIIAINRAWRRFALANGLSGDDYGLGSNYLAICDAAQGPDAGEAAGVAAGLRRVLAGQQAGFWIEYACHGPGAKRWFVLQASRIEEPGPGRVVVVHHNITERKMAEIALQRERDFIATVIDTAASLVVVLDHLGRIVRFNHACEQLTGYGFAEVRGRHLWDQFLLPSEITPVVAALDRLRAGQNPVEFECQWVSKDGVHHVIAWSSTVLRDVAGVIDYFITTGIDITARRKAEEALRELAIRDGLTGLYNRRELTRLLHEELQRYARAGGSLVLVLLDIDHFKGVNDAHGHLAGDEVLRRFATVLEENLRPTDRLARYGGEEFAILLPATTAGEAFRIAERLRQAVAVCPFVLEQAGQALVRVPLTISLGIAGVPHHAVSELGLIQAADAALYEAKRRGRNCTVHSAMRFRADTM